ncbi:hypothetical protein LV780_08890 [Cereibacter azotoformans]|uniref:Lipoprotein n=1 Tax=Cereibacter azotoformans TaxID=43057 RepID=A0A2T5KB06_9RHOB|nr:hypothetical protein [Cereibacter azotoformans]AXQ93906.1 hypothetical protein D0Z66_08930 [Cereibacter sphaeroides]MBO4168284.1 hypothetical protein [Cereibacter azotoformans]PTR19598.1 hypothetical protein C8J28_10482 [Cereibacter azotoformans]UIJ29424.1 hypothetical protein LV780_08890 [Cereibacter azotoformans]
MRPAVLFPVGLALAGLASCAPPAAPEAALPDEAFTPVYKGIETRLLDDDLVEFLVEMEGARGIPDVEDYARCAAAQYTLIRGYGFARHLRTNVAERGGVWRGDAIYTISAALPRGVQTIDAEVTVRDCREQGIPTI